MDDEMSNRTIRESDHGHGLHFIRAGTLLLERIARLQSIRKNRAADPRANHGGHR
jgi:hypothetical protein